MPYNLNYIAHHLKERPENYLKINNPNIDQAYLKRMFGGEMQQQRMIVDKLKSFDRALISSYQRAFVQKQGEDHITKALINPDKLKQDYDDKIFSIRYEEGYKPGDIFEWKNTKTFWIIYLQDIDELAYFRGSIRRCNYHIRWKDSDGVIRETYAAERGPVETKINYIQKVGISVDRPNYSLNILMPKTQATLDYFVRYAKFYLPDANMPDKEICWRVEAVNSISTPGILEITAVEYYANEFEDDVEQGVAKGKILTKTEQIELADEEEKIIGEVFIKPRVSKTYKYLGTENADWEFDKKLPIQIIEKNDKTITIKWNSSYSGQFDLSYGEAVKTIVVESLF